MFVDITPGSNISYNVVAYNGICKEEVSGNVVVAPIPRISSHEEIGNHTYQMIVENTNETLYFDYHNGDGKTISNLLENAVLHAKGMTELKLKVELIEDKAEFSVEDNGCGLNKGLSIEQNSPPADGGRNNLGIGLSLCSAIIKAHGSNLISIDKPGGGAIFKFALKTEVIDFER